MTQQEKEEQAKYDPNFWEWYGNLSKREKELYEARHDELIASNKLHNSGLVKGTPEYDEAYRDWSIKYWKLKELQRKDDNIYDAQGCAQLTAYLLVIGFVFYWIIKGLFSIKYW